MSTGPASPGPEFPRGKPTRRASPEEATQQVEFRRPWDEAAEMHVLSSCLIDPAALDDPDVARLAPEDFASDKHRLVWTVIQNLWRQGEAPTLVSVIEGLRSTPAPRYADGNALSLVGPGLVQGLMDQADSAVFAPQHARIVRKYARLRRTASLAARAVRAAQEDTGDPDDVQASLSRDLTLEMALGRSEDPDDSLAQALRILEPGGGNLLTGLPDLDRLTGGLGVGMTVLAGRPSMGKSALARQLHRNFARQNIKSAYFTMDQTVASYYRLEASVRTGLPLDSIRYEMQRRERGMEPGRVVSDAQLQEFRQALRDIHERYPERIALDGTPYELGALLGRIREEVRNGAEVVTVDYIQQIPVRSVRMDQGTQRVTAISTSLKNLANELQIPILAVAQLSRAVESRSPSIPRLSDLRESGSIEQDALAVWLLYRSEYYDARAEGRAEQPQAQADVIVPKNKEGAVGDAQLLFTPKLATFETYSSFLGLRTPETKPLMEKEQA